MKLWLKLLKMDMVCELPAAKVLTVALLYDAESELNAARSGSGKTPPPRVHADAAHATPRPGQQGESPAQGKTKGQNPRPGRGRGQGRNNSPAPTTPMQVPQILQPPSRSDELSFH